MMKHALTLTVVSMLLIACGSGEAPLRDAAPTGEVATAEPVQQVPRQEPEAPTATPKSGPTPQPVTARVSPTETPAATAETMTPVPTPTPDSGAAEAPTTGMATPSAAATSPPTSDDIDCGSFASPAEAQRFFVSEGGPDSDQYGLDTDEDGFACNAITDVGYDRISFVPIRPQTSQTPVPTVTATVPKRDCDDFVTWQEVYDFFISEGGPDSDPHNLDADRDGVPCTALKNDEERTPVPTPTFQPAETVGDVWSSDEHTAELNGINRHAFRSTRLSGLRRFVENGVNSIAAPGELIFVPAKDENGMPTKRTERVECAERFGNRLDDRNPSFYEKSEVVWLWIEPTDGGEPFCVNVDRYRNWLAADSEPLPEPYMAYSFPRADKREPLVFTDAVNGPQQHTLPPLLPPGNINNFLSSAIGKTFEIPDTSGTKLECTPQNVPVAVWTFGMGFEVLSREEKELLARYALSDGEFRESATGRKWWQFVYGSEDPDRREQFLRTYDWESKDSWREEGWFLAIISDPYDNRMVNEHWRNDVTYRFRTGIEDLAEAACWKVWNVEDLPGPRYCLECERRANMAESAASR